MKSKAVIAVLLMFAAIPASYAEHYGRGSESSPFASKPLTGAVAASDQQGRASNYGQVAVAPKSEVKAKLAAVSDVPGRA